MEEVEATAETLRRLKALGVCLSIDDFGTGYSSLSYLKRFPVDLLKIDRSFVGGLGTDAEDQAIVHAVVSLAHALGLEVVGEGVETADQLRELQHLGCDAAQGYLIGRPEPAEPEGPSLAPGFDGFVPSRAAGVTGRPRSFQRPGSPALSQLSVLDPTRWRAAEG